VRLFAPAVSVTVSLDAAEMTLLARSTVLALGSSEREKENQRQRHPLLANRMAGFIVLVDAAGGRKANV